jgi:hypothetical protein
MTEIKSQSIQSKANIQTIDVIEIIDKNREAEIAKNITYSKEIANEVVYNKSKIKEIKNNFAKIKNIAYKKIEIINIFLPKSIRTKWLTAKGYIIS